MKLTGGVLVLTAGLCAAADPVERQIGFDHDQPGQPPSGWTQAITGDGMPVWHVEAAADAPSPPHVLKQSGQVPRRSFPVCLPDASAVRDGFVEVKFKPISGEIDQAAGLVWRAQDANNYYLCRANALENNVVLYKVHQGQRTALDIVRRKGGYGVDVKVPSGQWQTLRVEFAGAQFRVLLDGRELFKVEDHTFTQPGKVGLWTKADSVTAFDDLRFGTVR
jgi:hypothetical protein